MDKREIKFRIIYKNKLIGFERLAYSGSNIHWEWMCLDLNPDKEERWSKGVFSNGFEYIRNQYTGLKDKDGKEIYNKDILERIILSSDKKTEYKDYAYVFFKDGAFLLRWNDNAETKISGFVNQMTVIGNIYSNPDLIKGGKE
jgi:uncharacterized phage protein (TIGR01671 family)